VGLFFRRDWKFVYLVMASTILVDIDHLMANPVYDPGRCSIGFHPLHGFLPIGLYVLLCFIPKSRYVGIGLVIHMALDSLDCQLTTGTWFI
jgi:hypothetical protein